MNEEIKSLPLSKKQNNDQLNIYHNSKYKLSIGNRNSQRNCIQQSKSNSDLKYENSKNKSQNLPENLYSNNFQKQPPKTKKTRNPVFCYPDNKCIFCLNENESSLINPCDCQYKAHRACLKAFIIYKKVINCGRCKCTFATQAIYKTIFQMQKFKFINKTIEFLLFIFFLFLMFSMGITISFYSNLRESCSFCHYFLIIICSLSIAFTLFFILVIFYRNCIKKYVSDFESLCFKSEISKHDENPEEIFKLFLDNIKTFKIFKEKKIKKNKNNKNNKNCLKYFPSFLVNLDNPNENVKEKSKMLDNIPEQKEEEELREDFEVVIDPTFTKNNFNNLNNLIESEVYSKNSKNSKNSKDINNSNSIYSNKIQNSNLRKIDNISEIKVEIED